MCINIQCIYIYQHKYKLYICYIGIYIYTQRYIYMYTDRQIRNGSVFVYRCLLYVMCLQNCVEQWDSSTLLAWQSLTRELEVPTINKRPMQGNISRKYGLIWSSTFILGSWDCHWHMLSTPKFSARKAQFISFAHKNSQIMTGLSLWCNWFRLHAFALASAKCYVSHPVPGQEQQTGICFSEPLTPTCRSNMEIMSASNAGVY